MLLSRVAENVYWSGRYVERAESTSRVVMCHSDTRMDLPVQWLGDEPNAHRKPWDTATVRWCLAASWPYEAAAGNQSIPAVYKAINDARPDFLCDRTYLPVTPRDLKLLDKAGIGMFGIESKHPLLDFDILGSSISYPVLSMSYLKLLTMSGIPASRFCFANSTIRIAFFVASPTSTTRPI